jgi:hypothetical protein
MQELRDPDVRILAAIAATLKPDYARREAQWAGSPFAWILNCSSRQRGKIGEQLVAGWCAAKNLAVLPSQSGQHDRIIQGKKVEIKFSTLWENGSYTFQQIRDQDYDLLICLGISPFDAHGWICPKSVAWRNAPSQHGGRAGRDTKWVSFAPKAVPRWLAGYGGKLSSAFAILKKL